MILLTTQFFFHSVTEAYNKFIYATLSYFIIYFISSQNELFVCTKSVYDGSLVPVSSGFFFFVFFFFCTTNTVLKSMLIGKPIHKTILIIMHSSDISFWSFVEYVLSVHFWGTDLYLLFDISGECMMICKSNFFFPVCRSYENGSLVS